MLILIVHIGVRHSPLYYVPLLICRLLQYSIMGFYFYVIMTFLQCIQDDLKTTFLKLCT